MTTTPQRHSAAPSSASESSSRAFLRDKLVVSGQLLVALQAAGHDTQAAFEEYKQVLAAMLLIIDPRLRVGPLYWARESDLDQAVLKATLGVALAQFEQREPLNPFDEQNRAVARSRALGQLDQALLRYVAVVRIS